MTSQATSAAVRIQIATMTAAAILASRVARPTISFRLPAALREDFLGDQPDDEHDPQRDDDQVVQVPQNGDEIRDQVDRGEGIADNEKGQGLRIPGDAPDDGRPGRA